jgi:hypothetical protein
VDAFERSVWPRIAADGGRADRLDRALVAELTGIAEAVLAGALRESMREAAEEFARRHDLPSARGGRTDAAADIAEFLAADEV